MVVPSLEQRQLYSTMSSQHSHLGEGEDIYDVIKSVSVIVYSVLINAHNSQLYLFVVAPDYKQCHCHRISDCILNAVHTILLEHIATAFALL